MDAKAQAVIHRRISAKNRVGPLVSVVSVIRIGSEEVGQDKVAEKTRKLARKRAPFCLAIVGKTVLDFHD